MKMINTYDGKTKVAYDLEGLWEHLQSLITEQGSERRKKIAEAEAYYQGYRDAIYSVSGTLEASNYRADSEEDK